MPQASLEDSVLPDSDSGDGRPTGEEEEGE